MIRKILGLVGFSLLVAVLSLTTPGSAGSGVPGAFSNDDLIKIACSDLDQHKAWAASDILSKRAIADPKLAKRLFANSGVHPCGNQAGRLAGLRALVDYTLSPILGGDPLIGKPLTARTAQEYADKIVRMSALGEVTNEREYIWAKALMIHIREGFAIVPGGVAEALNRIQTCLNGKLESNQKVKHKDPITGEERIDPAVAGVAIDCGNQAIRRALADTIANGFYQGFRHLPVVNLSCEDLKAQAEKDKEVKKYVEKRWAAALAYAKDSRCTPKTIDALNDVAATGKSVELRSAPASWLAFYLARSGAKASDLLDKAEDLELTPEQRLAYAWAAGLLLEKELTVDKVSCNPMTKTTGDLFAWSLAHSGAEVGWAAVAPLARYYDSTLEYTKDRETNVCKITKSTETLVLTIAKSLSPELPLLLTVPTLP